MIEEPYWIKLGGLAVVRYGLYSKLVQDGQDDENTFSQSLLGWTSELGGHQI
jgi:hypothetical protein